MNTPFMTPLNLRGMLRPEKWLTPDDLPNELLGHLDRAWAQRQRWNVALEATIPGPREMFAQVEKLLVEGACQQAAGERLAILTSTGPQWFARPFSFDPAETEAGERPWKPGSELPDGAHWQAVCRMSGWAVPTYTEET
jgi:hypothetical protein